MNYNVASFYSQLVNAVVRPRKAVELALQHSSPRNLAWIFVGLLPIATEICDRVARILVETWRGAEPTPDVALSWFDSGFIFVPLAILIYSVLFIVTRWYWNRFVKLDVRAVDAAIVAGFSFSLVTTPLYALFSEMTSNLRDIWGFLAFSALPLIEMAFSAAYFCFALSISAKKSVVHTVFSNLLVLVVVASLAMIVVICWKLATGMTWNEITGAA
jgi:hypothetical protein